MPFLAAAFLGGLIEICGSLVGRVLLALGLSLITYKGIDTSLTFLTNTALNNLQGGLTANILGMLGVMKVGQSIGVVTSAITARLAINGLTSDGLKKLVQK
jgi:Protein of unknown function (DUF2523)